MSLLNRKRTLLLLALLASHFGVRAQEEPALLDSLPEHLLYLYTRSPKAFDGATQNQLVAAARRWEVGRTLRVCFFGGNKTVTTLIREVASEWNAYSSTKFDFGPAGGWNKCTAPNGNYEIRVGFGAKGYWSAVGTDAESLIDALAPSMNFEMFSTRYSASRPHETVVADAVPSHKAAIRHEFGHALGLLHEASNPALNCYAEIRWTGTGNAYEFFERTEQWDRETVERNLGHVAQTDPDFISGEPDLESNMLYSLPAEILKLGKASKCHRSPNLLISKKDAAFVARIYPPAGTPKLLADFDLKKANIKAMPSALTPAAFEDAQARIVADLESSDTFIRRNARARLSELVSKDPSGTQVAKLLSQGARNSYRHQLGVAVAVANSSAPVAVDSATLKALKLQQQEAKDKALKVQLKEAIKKLKLTQ